MLLVHRGIIISPDDSGGVSSPQNVLPIFCIRLLQFENVHVPLSCMDSHEQYTLYCRFLITEVLTINTAQCSSYSYSRQTVMNVNISVWRVAAGRGGGREIHPSASQCSTNTDK